jgi:hypothetical protein
MRIELQTFGFNGFVAGNTNTISDFGVAAESFIDLSHFFVVPPRQPIKKLEPILIRAVTHPLGILFDFAPFPLQML